MTNLATPTLAAPARDLVELEGLLTLPQHQERSHKRFERILDVGEKILIEKGYEGMRVADICRRARCNTSTFYQRIADKDALLAMIQIRCYMRARDEMSQSKLARASGRMRLDRLVQKLTKGIVEIFRDNEELYRIFAQQTGHNPLVKEAMRSYNAWIKGQLLTLLEPHRDALAHPDFEYAVQMGAQVVISTMTTTLLVDHGPHDLHDEKLEKSLAEIFLFVLGGGKFESSAQ